MKIRKIIALLFSFCVTPILADETTSLDNYIDSLQACRQRIDSLYDSGKAGGGLSAYNHYKLFAPQTFYRLVPANMLLFGAGNDDMQSSEVGNALMNIYLNRPWLVVNSQKNLDDAGKVREDISSPIRNEVEYVTKDEPLPEDVVDIPVDVVVKKPNFWTIGGDYYLQFLQNYISGNWYKGGESNYSMVASAVLQANYNNKQKVKFDNKLEMKLGFQTSRSDSLHSLKTSEDLIRYTGKLGLQASKRWYYTVQLIAYTQFMHGYKSNDPHVYSEFLSPLNVNLGVGMDYQVDAFKSRLKGTVHLAPIAYNFRYVGLVDLATRYGLDEGKHVKHDIGSEMTVDLVWNISDNVKWKTRLYGYTTYERAEVEWENTFTFQLSKYLSTNLFVYPRFDDSTKRDPGHGYWQFKEYMSFGFAYSF